MLVPHRSGSPGVLLVAALSAAAACGTPSDGGGLDRPAVQGGAGTDTGDGGPAAADDDTTGDDDPGAGDDTTVEGDDTAPEGDDDALYGWIGSPCTSSADCPYSGASCLTDGFPGGMCTLACDDLCPDADGFPTTFCVDGALLPAAAADLGDGACHSRCDFSAWPGTGCRDAYGCVPVTRANDPSAETWACLPERESELPGCYLDLAARGVGFEPRILADSHPDGYPELTCHVENALELAPRVGGVDVRYYHDDAPDGVTVSCDTAHSIADTVEDVSPLGVVELVHLGTYSCRTISGSSTLSQHGLANAIDIHGFVFDDGGSATVFDHWEDGDAAPESWQGAFLYDAVHRWYDDWIWNIILTPEYNSDHDDHFHVDMTGGSHSLHFAADHFLGPGSTDE